jgi:hypothetical protein
MENYELKYKTSPESKRINRFILSYSRGRLKKIDRKSGDFDLELLAERVPLTEDDITPRDGLKKIENTAKEDVAFFMPANRIWCDFYEKQTGLLYRFGEGDAIALKKIGQHLVKVSGGVDEALAAWEYLLKNWNALDDFYKRNVDIKFINSQLNKILNLMKNGQQTGQAGARNHANDFRQRFNS